MQPADSSDDLVVSTPERVAFQYPVAGLGSRFLAQTIDLAVMAAAFLILGFATAGLADIFRNPQLGELVALLLGFVIIFGYFLVSEAVSSGQTLGKRALRLRVVGDHGEPLNFSQAAIRNLVRIVDFLPLFYGLGIITIFANGQGKRLGDLAAGTLVVRERQRVSLFDLASTASGAAPTVVTPAPPPSIWGQPPAPPPVISSPADQLARLDPALRRLVVAYAARRNEIPAPRRTVLAEQAAAALRKALPEISATRGPLAALDHLAEIEGVTPVRPMARRASWAVTFGVVSLVGALVVWVWGWAELASLAAGIVAIVLGTGARRAVRARPQALQGEDRANLGRILGAIGAGISGILLLFMLIGLAVHG